MLEESSDHKTLASKLSLGHFEKGFLLHPIQTDCKKNLRWAHGEVKEAMLPDWRSRPTLGTHLSDVITSISIACCLITHQHDCDVVFQLVTGIIRMNESSLSGAATYGNITKDHFLVINHFKRISLDPLDQEPPEPSAYSSLIASPFPGETDAQLAVVSTCISVKIEP